MISHDLVDNIEKKLSKDLNILLTAHMDPVTLRIPTENLSKTSFQIPFLR